MKTLKLFSLMVCMIFCGLTANAQTKVLQTPDEAEYFIKGNLNIQRNSKGNIEYTLTNVSTKGITFDMKDVYEGTLNDKIKEQILFEFENAKTDYNGGFENRDNRLQYWRKVSGIWQPDTETNQGGKDTTFNNYINIMLVLDCSNSLGSDFDSVKSSAKQFIERLYRVAPNGNIRVGIIGFSTINNADKHALEIYPLDYSSKDIMINRIENFPQGNGTALYYSLDQAIKYLEDNSKTIKEDDYLGSFIITFTDGIDQQSHDYDRDIFTADEYYENIKPILQGINRTKIYNKNIEHTIIALRGTDIPDAMVKKFEGDLKTLCDEYIPLTNINELSRTFSQKAEDLINRSTKLQCFVSMGFQGEVGWTFGSVKKEIKKQNKIFLGINAGMGAGFYSYSLESSDSFNLHHLHESEEGGDFSIPFNAGVDFAFRLTDSFYLGAYGSIGMLPWDEDDNRLSPSFGLLTLFNQKNEKAIIIGAGTCIPNFSTLGMNFRIGYKFKNNLYLFGEFTTYSYSSSWINYKYVDDCKFEIINLLDKSSTSFFLHFGYRIF